MRLSKMLYIVGGLSLALSGCSGPESDPSECAGGKCDDVDEPDSKFKAHPCDGVFADESGRNVKRFVNRLKDPLIDKVYRGITKAEDCPTTYAEILARLRVADKANCVDSFDDLKEKERKGLLTSLISETAQVAGEATSYRS